MRSGATYALLLVVATLFAFSPAAAMEGIVSIDQDDAIHGVKGCPKQHGFPIQICHSGSYKLTSNLAVTTLNTDVIQIMADDVTLDLNGFTISGPWTPADGFINGSGVYSPSSNIRIKNGILRGFPQGIFLTGSNLFVEGVTVTGNFFGIDIFGSTVFTTRITATNNNSGIVLFGGGMVSNSFVASNKSFGIFIQFAGGYGDNTIVNNTTQDVAGGASAGTNVCTSGKC